MSNTQPTNISFNERVYEIVATIPQGKVMTYKEVAHLLNCRAYRAVGNALNKNPYSTSKVPCHRVIKTNNEVGGYGWDVERKIELLEAEGVEFELFDDTTPIEKRRVKREHIINKNKDEN
ncbi:MAG: MGMT family protein [Candidatus Nanoarchaeia archaeon]